MPPHLVHRKVQYSDPDFPAMTRRIASGAWHSGQCDSAAEEGDWVGAVSDSTMGCAIFKIGLERFQAKHALGLDPGVETGSRQENASNQESRAPFRFNRNGKALGGRLFGPRYLAGCRVSLQLELVDLGFRIRDRGLGVEPCKADLERRKRNVIDDHGFQVRPPDTGMPQPFSSLESLDFKAVMVALHGVAPVVSRIEGNMRRPERV
jgi:hypothetical protein